MALFGFRLDDTQGTLFEGNYEMKFSGGKTSLIRYIWLGKNEMARQSPVRENRHRSTNISLVLGEDIEKVTVNRPLPKKLLA